MDHSAGPAGLPEISAVFLVQTDTTVGFASRDAARLNTIKKRPPYKPFLKTYASLKDYKKEGRIPSKFKREARRKTRTTYIVKNRALRIVPDGPYHHFLHPFGWLYSTSANISGKRFDPAFARLQADIVVEDARGLFEAEPSQIFRLGQQKKITVR